ncbi:hypothetical protein CXF86_03620 [Shewanella sp. GutCb]|nr:hypothetical protein CXF86_03620 [Shewanella sp. GutCb]
MQRQHRENGKYTPLYYQSIISQISMVFWCLLAPFLEVQSGYNQHCSRYFNKHKAFYFGIYPDTHFGKTRNIN